MSLSIQETFRASTRAIAALSQCLSADKYRCLLLLCTNHFSILVGPMYFM